jgi:hypothetical protein
LFIDDLDLTLPLDLHDDDGDHQDQVKVLLTKTADSLDDIALKILFVSVQQNNLELCLTYAVKQYAFDIPHNITYTNTDSSLNPLKNMVCTFLVQMKTILPRFPKENVVYRCLQWFGHAYVG